MKPNDLVVFALDGTLVDTPKWIVAYANEARRELGFQERCMDEIKQLIGSPPEEFWSDISGLTHDLSQKLTLIYRRRFDQHNFNSGNLYDGVIGVLEHLTDTGSCIALASNKLSQSSKMLLEKCGILNFFSEIVGSDSCAPKPSIEMLKQLSIRCSIPSTRMIMIGDRVHDVVCASNFGALPIGLAQTVDTKKNLAKAGALIVFSDMSELYEHLRR